MAEKTKKDKTDDDDDDDDDDNTPDPRDEAKTLIREVVDEALAAWTKKNKPPPRRTDPDKEGQLSWFESLFGSPPK